MDIITTSLCSSEETAYRYPIPSKILTSSIHPPRLPLQRHGSGGGGSVVLDPPEAEVEVEAESRKLPSSRYKGVVPQPNGRWGAQIYEKHQRVWLGTFNDETTAAKAYDVAVQRFRGRDAVTNFPHLSDSDPMDAAELLFISSHSKSEVVDMLRKHTYHDELCKSRRYLSSPAALGRAGMTGFRTGPAAARELLFDKAVTPSDVGKLNRLVIPKQHAERYFPLDICGVTATKGILLNFEDAMGKVWRFRYSYWNSSQSYVLTKGWTRFVKEKKLKAGDVVAFLRSTGHDRQLYINSRPRPEAFGPASMPEFPPSLVHLLPERSAETVRLFGVNIVGDFQIGRCDSHAAGEGRRVEMELFPLAASKKQCIRGLSIF